MQSRINLASPGIITPPVVAISHFKTLEGTTAGMLRYEVTITGDIARPVSVNYQTLPTIDTNGEFTPASGMLTWQPRDNTSRVIEIPFSGDGAFEGDEAVLVALTDPSNAVLANDLGAGFMINDDAFSFTASTGESTNDLQLALDGAAAAFYANGENVFSGVFSEGTPAVVTGAVGSVDSLTIDLGDDNLFLTGGLTFVGDGGDSLTVNDEQASVVVHTSTG